uniref:Uncharacterized protein n=1 Tax=Cannabis sativa TaxID=3483 RepID=A0A803PFJ9_CANSA
MRTNQLKDIAIAAVNLGHVKLRLRLECKEDLFKIGPETKAEAEKRDGDSVDVLIMRWDGLSHEFDLGR